WGQAVFDIALSAVIGSTRFDLGFYAGRIFGLIAASFLLVTLIVEMAQMYAGALSTVANAERKVAELGRMRPRADDNNARPRRGEPTESFIRRQNIEHYRSLLESGSLDQAQRRSIEKLLSEEEARYKAGASQS
ncbi:MAG: hypothetical protein ACXU9D_20485, partial [Xanthobacteraceae bacterium]